MTDGIDPIHMLTSTLWHTANGLTGIFGLSVEDVGIALGCILALAIGLQFFNAATGRTSFSLEKGARRNDS